jgi:hypothetical protein
MMLSVPTGNFFVISMAVPALNVAGPRTVVPFLNVTVPVGPPGAPDSTFAVNVTI